MFIQNVAEFPPHHETRGPGNFEVSTSNGLGGAFKRKIHYLTFYLGIKGTLNIAQHPLYHVNYSTVKYFKVTTAYGLGRKYII